MAYLYHICYYHLWELQRVCRYLNHEETAVRVANALVSSRLDYCNLLLYNTKRHILADYKEFKMHYVVLHKLHWLPIHYCILFKYNLTHKAIHFSQPPYLSSLIRWSNLTWGNCLSISSSKPTKRFGLHSFTVAAPREWNKLPQTIRTVGSISGFRKQLKTYLFRLAYPPP